MVKRPILRYHGGKWKLADWIISHFPKHRIYCEPYGGGASVLLKKPRAYCDVYNDLDSEIVNVFRMARERGPELKEQLRLTPFSREDFQQSFFHSDDAMEQARRTIVRAFMGFGSSSATCGKNNRGNSGTGFRSNSNRSGSTPAHDWKTYAEKFDGIIERLRGGVIENRNALEVMAQHDTPDTLHYVDPPYVMETRKDNRSDYRHEMTNDDHIEMARFLHGLKGMVVLSGYRCDLYDSYFADWQRIDRDTHADGAGKRVESLWLSPNIQNWRLF